MTPVFQIFIWSISYQHPEPGGTGSGRLALTVAVEQVRY